MVMKHHVIFIWIKINLTCLLQKTGRWTGILAAVLFTCYCDAQQNSVDQILILSGQQSKYNIYSTHTQTAHVVHDPFNHWKMDDFISGEKNHTELLSEPASQVYGMGGTYWLVIETKNIHHQENWHLHFSQNRVDSIDIAVRTSGSQYTQIHHSGMQTNASERNVIGLGHTFPLALPSGQHAIILLRVDSYIFEGALYISLEEASSSKASNFNYQVWALGGLGLMLGLTIYNIFIFLVIRDISYLWYSCFGISLTLTWSSYYGLLWFLFDWHDPHRYIAAGTQIGVLLFSLLFTQSFLNLNQLSKLLNHGFNISALILLIVLSVMPFIHTAYIFDTYWLMMLLCSTLVLSASFYGIISGYRPARFLICGHLILAFGIFKTGLGYLGLLSVEEHGAHYFTAMIGAEMVLLSIALADRINQLRNDKRIAEEANELKSSFLAMMSHEIRTPLNGLLGMIKLLSRSHLDPRQQRYVESIDYSGNALLSMLNGLLDYSKLETNNIELEHIPYDPKKLTDSLVMLMSARASEKGLILSARVDRHLPPVLYGDPNRIRQILLNLLGNAIKFTHRGVVNIHVTQQERFDDTLSLTFSVEDSGIGISPQDQEKIFDMFTQADASITRRFGGTGLGLSICKRLVELMGGTLTVNSEQGKGSCFKFTLRVPYSETPESANTAPSESATPIRPLQILLVDDVELNRVAATGLLEHEGHQVTTAKSAVEALELIKARDFDAVLMDIHMPEMDGLTATQHIRQFNEPEKAGVPVIALTANASIEQRDEYLKAGVDGVVAKPLDIDQLLQTMNELTGNTEGAQKENDSALSQPA